MSDIERDLKSMLEQLADDAPIAHAARAEVVKRSMRRRLGIPAGALLAVAVLAGGVLAATGPLTDKQPTPPSASESPTDYDNPGPYTLGDDPSTDKRIEVARGERLGMEWTLYAYRDQDGSLCVGDKWDSGGGEGCGPRPNSHHINPAAAYGGDVPEAFMYGELSYEVARVEVRLEGEDPFDVPVLPDPADFGVNFFVAFIPIQAAGDIVVYASDGEELESTQIMDFDVPGDPDCDEDECTVTPPSDPEPPPNSCLGDKVTIEGTEGPDVLEGTPGFDVIRGLGGDDIIRGLGDSDWICGGEGDDQIFGGPGGDEIWGGPGDDLMDGEEGNDEVAYWFSESGITADLNAGTATGEGDDSLANFERFGGSKLDDFVTGTDDEDQIETFDGDDRISALGGDDYLVGGEGDDQIDGGEGRDYAGFWDTEGAVTVDLNQGTSSGQGEDLLTSIEIVHGTEFDDTLIGSDADESMSGREGSDRISGGGGDDELWGEYPRFTAEQYRKNGPYMKSSDDQIDGGTGNDTIGGGPGTNTCTGGETTQDCV